MGMCVFICFGLVFELGGYLNLFMKGLEPEHRGNWKGQMHCSSRTSTVSMEPVLDLSDAHTWDFDLESLMPKTKNLRPFRNIH